MMIPKNVDTTGIDVSYHWSERGLKLPFQGATGLEARATILTRIDHVTIGVADLKTGIAAYTRIGFDIDSNGTASNDGDHLQLAPAPAAGGRRRCWLCR